MIVLNEEKKIGRSLTALSWADEIVVVDGGSVDQTMKICREAEVRVFHRPFDNFESQKNYALSLTRHEWVLSIDADEVVPQALAEEIKKKVQTSRDSVNGYFIRRNNYFLGRPLRFAKQREKILRLFRRDKGKFVGLVHETIRVIGDTGTLQNTLEHFGTENFAEYFEKLKLYTSLETNRLIQENRAPSYLEAIFKPPAKWVLNYVILGGFLDGKAGFFYHGLSCYYDWIKNFKALRKNVEK